MKQRGKKKKKLKEIRTTSETSGKMLNAPTFESVLMRWMKLEPIIQSEVSQAPE